MEGFDLIPHALKGDKGMNLVCIIASVIREPRRLRYFRMMLDSIRAQKVIPTQIMISIHIDPALMPRGDDDWKALFAGFPVDCLFVYKQKRAKRQFVQIREMLARIAHVPGKETFVMFSDDDDLWHPERAAVFFAYFDLLGKEPIRTTSSFLIREQTECTNGPPCTKCQRENEDNVDAMLACGCVKISFPSRTDVTSRLYEYHQYAVRPRVMEEFFQHSAQLVENNRFADMQFRLFVATYGGAEWKTCVINPAHWTYYYRQCDKTYAAATNACIDGHLYADNVVDYYLEMADCPAMGIDQARKGLMKNVANSDPEMGVYMTVKFCAALENKKKL